MTKQKQMTEKVELSDEELDGVAGGASVRRVSFRTKLQDGVEFQ